ncbi:sensor histidine kinase [Paenibacillus aceti]|uniref:histidine kinase n=1 Tax=Paenibacillus aceti TaxID=1820010 RepID=A0ABQ1VNQ4_9BACL|nr:HAMP domain-containing sensor histidine kinase [Paenibacillus aceti]GGF85008.1 two-component sensor histidine kinase [Paenibacillus aceti]
MSIRLRLTAWYTSILAVVLILFGASFYGLVRYYTYQEVKNRLEEQVSRVRSSFYLTNNLNVQVDAGQLNRLEDAQIYVQVYNYLNRTLSQSPNMQDLNLKFPVPDATSSKRKMTGFQRIHIGSNSFLLYQGPLTFDDKTKDVVHLLQMGAYTGAEDRLLDLVRTVLLIGSSISLVFAGTLGMFLARQSMAPIGKVIEAANGIQTGNDLSVRIDYDGPDDEIGQLIGTVNRMLERTEGFYNELDEAYLTQRRFVSDASHELRTPLTTIRGNVDLLQKMWGQDGEKRVELDEEQKRVYTLEAITDIADESRRMSRLVNDLLSLARADAGKTIAKEPLALSPLIEEVIRRAQFLPRNAAWLQGDLEAVKGVAIMGNKDYLQQLLFIFIENAFKYTPEGSVTIDAARQGEQIGIRISDTGIGMDKDEVPHIFERFYRADPSRGEIQGVGLGLSIAKWIIDEHDGSVEVVTKQGEGTTFIIWLPAVFNALPE